MTSGFHRIFGVLAAVAIISACTQTSVLPAVTESAGQSVSKGAEIAMSAQAKQSLKAVLDAQSPEEKARYGARHPAETLAFFGIEPGMTVAEALPGGGWYTRILAGYLGSEGEIYGVNYQDTVWKNFGLTGEKLQQRIGATAKFPMQVSEWSDSGVAAEGFTFDTVPADAVVSADAVLFIRALHNLYRYQDSGILAQAIEAAHAMLKTGGIVGVVQHRAPENAPDEWASGRAGYLKPSSVIKMFTESGFALDGSSEINANPKDKPTPDDVVWRLPPSYAGGEDTKAAMDAIGESDRMTLRFRKL